ncbi:MAG TPA: CoA pyrophosphatase [Acidimicrobiales bacterium]|nr:CoA pyrophosphatase [Acidimicrobiales bacterium]
MTRHSSSRERFEDHDYPQLIPEPADVRTGGPAPWAHLGPDARRGLDLAAVVERLHASGRTGAAPQRLRELEGVVDAASRPATRRSAVLVALYELDGETQVILTRRSVALRNHRGEVALPGGRSDPGESPAETALREAHEEVGLDPREATLVGWLSPIASFASESAIWPVVATLAHPPTLVADPTEVERVFSVALADLVADGTFVAELWRREARRPGADDEGYFPIYFFKVPGEIIWGATARVLTELLCVTLGVAWPGERLAP